MKSTNSPWAPGALLLLALASCESTDDRSSPSPKIEDFVLNASDLPDGATWAKTLYPAELRKENFGRRYCAYLDPGPIGFSVAEVTEPGFDLKSFPLEYHRNIQGWNVTRRFWRVGQLYVVSWKPSRDTNDGGKQYTELVELIKNRLGERAQEIEAPVE